MRQQSAYTPQVCMMTKIIHDELGLNAVIEEENGKPYDFSVDVTVANTDVERRLIALISKYKLAGKNFTLNNAAVTWGQSWGGYVCEEKRITVNWGGYVCEGKYRPINVLRCTMLTERSIIIDPDLAPTSDLHITFGASWWDPNDGNAHEYTTVATIPKGNSLPTTWQWDCDVKVMYASLDIQEDDNYIYTIDWREPIWE